MSESTELVVVNNAETAIEKPAVPSAWGNTQLKTERHYIRLRKGEKGDALKDYPIGHFVDTKGFDSFGEAEIVLMPFFFRNEDGTVGIKLVHKGRKLQSPYSPSKKRVTHCVSNDRITPVAGTEKNGLKPKAKNCKDCAFGQKAWEPFRNKTGDKPVNPCELTSRLLFFKADDLTQPYLYDLEGGDRKIVEEFEQTLLNFAAKEQKTKGIVLQPFHIVLKLSAQTNASGNYEPVLKIVEILHPEDQKEVDKKFADAFTSYSRAIAEREAEEEQAEADEQIENAVSGTTETETVQTVTEPVEPVKPKVNIPAASTRRTGARPAYKPPVQPEVLAPEKTGKEDDKPAEF